MRYSSLGGILLSALVGAWPLAAHADYLANARASLQKGDLRAAQIDLRNAVRADPQNAQAHYWLGKVSFELGDPVAAEREAIAARDRGFDPHLSVPLLAQAWLSQGKFDSVLQNIQPDGKDASLDASILVFRAYAYIGLKQPDEAQRALNQAETTAPDAVDPLLANARLALSKGDVNGAQAKIDRALVVQPKSVEALLAKAQLLRIKGDASGALAVLDDLINEQPATTQARLDRGSLEIALNKMDAAKADIDAVLKATPGNVQAIYLQAVMKTQQHDFKGADADLERVVAYIPRLQRGYYLQAVVKEQLGQMEQAEEAARRYLSRAPNDLAGYKVLARIQFAKRRPDQVIDTLSRLAESGKGDAETYDLLGRAYAATNHGDDAVKTFQKAEALAPNDVGLQTRLATVRMGLGQPDLAMGDLEHTLEVAPKLPAVSEALFFAALATGDLNKATDAVAKIHEAQGDTPVVQNLEGLLKLAKLDVTGARDTFAAIVAKSPDFIPAKVNLARTTAMTGNSAGAEKLLSDILAKQPTSEPALTMLASTYAQTQRVDQAISLLERAHQAEPSNARITVSLGDLYIRAGKAQQALDLASTDKASSSVTIATLGLRGAAQIALGQKDKARDTYTALLKEDPTQLGARHQLVQLLVDAGEYEQARSVVKAGITISPRNYQLYQDYVLIDLKAADVDAALASAAQLQNQDREFTAAKALTGDVYLAANRPEDAARAYAEANVSSPSSMFVTRAASAYLRAGKPDDAAKMLTGWIEKHPQDVAALEQSAEIAIALNRSDDAIGPLQEILKQKPHDPVALNNLAWVYGQKNDSRALELARQAYILSPGAQTADTLGWILIGEGKANTGIALLRQASAEAGNDPRVQYHYAVALKDTGQKDDAIKVLNTVTAYKGEFAEKRLAEQLLNELKGS